jgi:hypothetical protein
MNPSIQALGSIRFLVEGVVKSLTPKSPTSFSVAKSRYTIQLSERQVRQLLDLFVGVYAWKECNPCNFNGSPWTSNQDPTTKGWSVPVFEFIGQLDRQTAHEYTLQETELIEAIRGGIKPFREGAPSWPTKRFREDRFNLDVRLRRNEILGIITLPHHEPNPHILSFLRTLWGPPDKDLTPTIRRLKGNLFLL